MIYQELHHCHDLSVTENLLMGHLPRGEGLLGKYVVDWARAYQLAEEHLAMLNVDIDPKILMGDLSVVEREIVEIVKAVSFNAKIIVMDEPTAALTPNEVEMLFGIIETLRDQGVGIIYISHRLDEIFRVAQRVTVLRDGRKVDTCDVADVTQQDLVKMMVGHEVEERVAIVTDIRSAAAKADVVFEVTELTRVGDFENVSLNVRAGEIVGIFGLLGAGHYALTQALFGDLRADSGTIKVFDELVEINSPTDARRAGIGLVPIDRKVRGLVLGENVRENLTLSNWPAVTRWGFFQKSVEKEHAQEWIDKLGIRVAGGMEVETQYMSGGNQQKVVLGRWLEASVRVLLLNEPTWGVDVGARSDIYDQLDGMSREGLGILMVSSDMVEVLSVSHRILTMYNGRITGEFMAGEATQEKLLHAAAGGES